MTSVVMLETSISRDNYFLFMKMMQKIAFLWKEKFLVQSNNRQKHMDEYTKESIGATKNVNRPFLNRKAKHLSHPTNEEITWCFRPFSLAITVIVSWSEREQREKKEEDGRERPCSDRYACTYQHIKRIITRLRPDLKIILCKLIIII